MNDQEAFVVSSGTPGAVQIGVGFYVLYQGEIRVGQVLVEAVDPDTTTEHWGLYREYCWPSALNVRQDLRFEYAGDGRDLSGTKLRESLPQGSTYVVASCRQEVIA